MRRTARESPSILGGSPVRQQGQQAMNLLAQLPAVHDHVDGAVLEQELRALKAFRQLLAHGLLDHARTREADPRAR